MLSSAAPSPSTTTTSPPYSEKSGEGSTRCRVTCHRAYVSSAFPTVIICNTLVRYSSVGTPDYIAPEVLRKVGYGPEADLWGVGCVLFEMLCGFPPFFSDDAHTTCRKIVQWRSYLKFPSDVHVEPQAQSLIRQLLCDGADRLTIAGCKVNGYLL